jgi:hypothetical protein
LNRHRGKGQQKVTVEHVHVHSGGQAVVGVVETPAMNNPSRLEDQHAKQIAHAPQPAMRSTSPEREAVPVASDAERQVSDAGGKSPGAPKGNENALKHGRYKAEAMLRRRGIAWLLRTMKALHRDLK